VTAPHRQVRPPLVIPDALPARSQAGRQTRTVRLKTNPDPEVATMTLTINDTTMTSDQTTHTARQAPGPQPRWEESWLPGQTLDRNTAITAMTLAETAAQADLHESHRLWPHIQGWAAELGLTAPDAIAQATQHPADINPHHERASGRPDREAAD
jgi:hypothetical protein